MGRSVLNQEEILHWLALRMVPGLGTLTAIRLLEKLKSPQIIFRSSATELEAAGLSPAQARNIASGCSFDDAIEQQQKMLNAGAQLVSFQDERYPSLFVKSLTRLSCCSLSANWSCSAHPESASSVPVGPPPTESPPRNVSALTSPKRVSLF